jgi:hypothetical protein
MSDYNISQLVHAISEIRDNIWLRDYDAAKSIIESNIKQASNKEILGLLECAEEIRSTTYELRKSAPKEMKVNDRRAWVRSRILKTLLNKQIDPVKNITGVHLIQLLGFRDMINLLTNSQKTLDDISPIQKELIISKKQGYKYSIDRMSNRWSVRAIFDKKFKQLDISKIQKFSIETNTFLDKWEGKNSNFFELFGKEMHVQIVEIDRVLEISISMPQSDDEELKVKKIAENILDSLNS